MITENPQYSSQGLRERTQELALYHLLDSESLTPDPPRPRAHTYSEADPTTRPRSEDRFHILEQREGRSSSELLRPEVIEEVSEPNSLGSSPSGTPRAIDPHNDERREGMGYDAEYVSSVVVEEADDEIETTSLLPKARLSKTQHKPQYGAIGELEDYKSERTARWSRIVNFMSRAKQSGGNKLTIVTSPKRWDKGAIWRQGVVAPVRPLPAVFLGLLLNLLDGLSYGIILFPLGENVFKDTAGDGISIFFVSTIVSQLVYTLGGSIFKGGVGSEMIEVVPFFHKMTYIILNRVGEDNPKAVMATTIVSYSMSAIITGIIFGLLGIFKLGNLVSFFPRSILTWLHRRGWSVPVCDGN